MANKSTSKPVTAAAVPSFKAPNNSTLEEFCHVFVQREITRGIGAEGMEACLSIGVLLDQVLNHYRTYARLVEESAGVDLARVALHFGENWGKISNAKRRMIEEVIRKEVKTTNDVIQGHIKYLETNRQHMDQLGPRGSAEVARKIVELTGSSEPMTSEKGGLAA
ncbi:hypothetical protein [Hymenobacter norwichensis]|uniref:hypothetical protein n=1 Tax=Hymenobacter norwichensis TaxID=223903 RepID=UPI0003B5671B|nr:hypothetical protein [Hymenobacter norwichensis]